MIARGLMASFVLLAGCSGYGDLPLPVRHVAELSVSRVDLYPDAAGRVEVAPKLPDDATGEQVMVIGAPESDSVFATVINWASGPCEAPHGAANAPPGTICVVVYTDRALGDLSFNLVWVVALRASGRRFSVGGEVSRP